MDGLVEILHALIYTVGLYHTVRWSFALVTSIRLVPKDRSTL